MVHGRFSGFGAPVNWIATDILRVKNGILVEHWAVIQDEATEEQSIINAVLASNWGILCQAKWLRFLRSWISSCPNRLRKNGLRHLDSLQSQ